MELLKVNHVITAVNDMLKNLVDTGVIEDVDRKNLLPVITLHAIRHDTIEIEGA